MLRRDDEAPRDRSAPDGAVPGSLFWRGSGSRLARSESLGDEELWKVVLLFIGSAELRRRPRAEPLHGGEGTAVIATRACSRDEVLCWFFC